MTPMSFVRVFCAVLMLASPAGAAAPKQTIYTCSLKVTRNQNWVPDQLVVSIGASDGKVLVFDPLISYFMTTPIPAKVVVDTADRMTLKWHLKRINKVKPNNMPTMVYTAKLNKSAKHIAISVTPLGYDNRFFADGTCKLQD